MSKHNLRDRYQSDPKFNRVVDTLIACMMQDDIAPDEIRDAAFVASVIYLETHPISHVVFHRDQLMSETIKR